MPTFTVHEAKTHLSKLIERAEAGEEVIIARGDKPAVRLLPLQSKRQPRLPGQLVGLAEPPDEFFFAPLSEAELKLWQGGQE
jgi:prevent-host-death family protein